MALANDLKTLTWIANKSLAYLLTNLPFIKCGKSQYAQEFDNREYAKGDSILVRRSNRRVGGEGATIALDGVIEKTETLTIDKQFNDGLSFTTKEQSLFLTGEYGREVYSERYIYPCINRLVHQINSYIGEQAEKKLAMYYGTPGAAIAAASTLGTIRAYMEDMNMPVEQTNYLIMTPNDGAQLKSALVNYFNPTFNKGIGENFFVEKVMDFELQTTSGVARHTSGTASSRGASTIQVRAGITSGTTLTLKGLTAGDTILPGDIFRVLLNYRIAPTTFKTTTHEIQCVVTNTTTVTADGSGYATVTFNILGSEGLITDTTNPFRNAPATGIPTDAYVEFIASHNVGIAFCDGALDYAAPKMQPMWTPYSVNVADTKFGTGINLRLSRSADIVNDLNIMRMDVLFGAIWHPEYAIRVIS